MPTASSVGPDETSSRLAREYLSGSLASSFTAAVFSPLEVVKTRLQVQDSPGWRRTYSGGFVGALRTIGQQDGLRLLWSHGLAPFVARDFWYSGVRTGMYPSVRNAISAASGRAAGEATLAEKIAAGALTGGLGAGLANPFDVVRVRMTCEGGVVDAAGTLRTGLRAGHAPRWRDSLHCAAETARREGALRGLLLRGIGPSVSRAALLTAAQMSAYDHCKTVCRRRGWLGDGVALHLLAALLSGFVAVAACNPADVLKSRIMLARSGSGATAVVAGNTVRGVVAHIWRHEVRANLAARAHLTAHARQHTPAPRSRLCAQPDTPLMSALAGRGRILPRLPRALRPDRANHPAADAGGRAAAQPDGRAGAVTRRRRV